MFRNFVVLLMLATVMVMSACGGGAFDPERTASARGIITCKPSSGSTGTAGKMSTIYFWDDGSESSNGTIVKWQWNFGDGWEDWTNTGGLSYHTFGEPGTYNAHLRVTDSEGRKGNGKVKIDIVEGYDAPVERMLWGVEEGDEYVDGSDGTSTRYHNWRWRCLAYDPENPRYNENHVLAISHGDPDFDLLRVYSEGSDKDFVTPDLDDDGVDDDPSVRRTFVLPHVLEVSGRCIGRSKEDVYVWKIKAVDSNGEKKMEYKGHVTVLK